ncbi:GtrA family protein [Patulibacter sp.]|uniref:GtrA family protein n=1 Tax=Patulibacter sp. TaxID=1912859 RepID=UPI00271C6CF3|nr:GtrA family protein [Patulibacter sp.]MDO9410146.1 GtrA family protein [Patulibacter sp.]
MSTSEFELPAPAAPLRVRLAQAARSRSAWTQLLRFAVVGATGAVVNLLVYAVAAGPLGWDYRLAALLGFAVAVTNNFALNRLWTFAGATGHAGFQAARFVAVSLAGLGVNLLVLHVLVDGFGTGKLVGQAIAIGAATPMSFVGNKLWSFAER